SLKQLVPGVRLVGFGGKRLAGEGCKVLYDLVDLAVMGVKAVVQQLGTFLFVLRLFCRHIEADRPDLIVLIDYPGLNFKIAQIARAKGIPVVYYICPQLWAWGPWRIRKARRLMGRALSILPFEKPYFEEHGIPTEYVGHPLIDHLDAFTFDEQALAKLGSGPPTLGLLPGSRRAEISANLPTMLRVAAGLKAEGLALRVAIPPARERLRPLIEELVAESDVSAEILPGKVYEVMKASRACLVTSGTAALELAYLGTPLAVLYRLTPMQSRLRDFLLSVPYIASINLIARRQVVPEFCGAEDPTPELLAYFTELWSDEAALARARAALDGVRPLFDRKGASRHAAEAVAEQLQAVRSSGRGAKV
ncbi:MAG: lipid-A-disaccharide synthase, partial [Planctomycetota bacterium]